MFMFDMIRNAWAAEMSNEKVCYTILEKQTCLQRETGASEACQEKCISSKFIEKDTTN